MDCKIWLHRITTTRRTGVATFTATLSNPDYFQDPDAAFGMLSGFSGYIGNMLGDYFGQNGYFGG